MTDLVFSAATSAAAATEEKQKHEFGAIPYERVLTIAECKKLEKTESRLHQRLDHFLHVWVRDARSFRHGKESDVYVPSVRDATP